MDVFKFIQCGIAVAHFTLFDKVINFTWSLNLIIRWFFIFRYITRIEFRCYVSLFLNVFDLLPELFLVFQEDLLLSFSSPYLTDHFNLEIMLENRHDSFRFLRNTTGLSLILRLLVNFNTIYFSFIIFIYQHPTRIKFLFFLTRPISFFNYTHSTYRLLVYCIRNL